MAITTRDPLSFTTTIASPVPLSLHTLTYSCARTRRSYHLRSPPPPCAHASPDNNPPAAAPSQPPADQEPARRVIDASRRRVRALELRNCVRTAERDSARAERAVRRLEDAGPELWNDEAAMGRAAAEREVLMDDLVAGRAALRKFDGGEARGADTPTEKADVERALALLEDAAVKLREVGTLLDTNGVEKEKGGDEQSREGTVDNDVGEAFQARLKEARKVRAKVLSGLEDVVSEVGTLDLDKVTSSTRWTLDRLGETWSRLNGVQAAEDSDAKSAHATGHSAVEDSELMSQLRREIEVLERRLGEASRDRESMLRQEDQLGKLIRAKEIRSMDDLVIEVRRSLAVRVLQLEMERIYLYLQAEIEIADEFMEERLLVAEFGELDEELAEMRYLVDQDEMLAVQDDQLGRLAEKVQFLKARLGLENDLYTTQLSWAIVRRQLVDLVRRTKDGGDFFFRGFRLIGGDVTYASRLVTKAATGSVLTPREVRTLRRTARDMLTLVPFTVILVAPLTPVGHVLVFSFIQRFLPDFFPSTFSEQRIEFMKRYERIQALVTTSNGSSPQNGAAGAQEGEEDGADRQLLRRAQAELMSYGKDLHLAE